MFETIHDPGVRITCIGMTCNLAIALLKLGGGWACESEIIVADGWHSLTDLTSDVLTLATVSCGIRNSAKSRSTLRSWAQSLGSFGMSGMLLAGGCLLGIRSAISLGEHFESMNGSASQNPNRVEQDVIVEFSEFHSVWIAAATVAVKEWLYRETMKVARNEKSSTLASNAAHHRMDSLSGMVTLVAVLVATLTDNAGWVDPLGGLLISIMTLNAGSKAILSVVNSGNY